MLGVPAQRSVVEWLSERRGTAVVPGRQSGTGSSGREGVREHPLHELPHEGDEDRHGRGAGRSAQPDDQAVHRSAACTTWAPELADNLIEGQATGSMWRTSALWGIGYTEKVAGNGIKVGYLHDSRARTLTEAILWHGGEGDYEPAAASRH